MIIFAFITGFLACLALSWKRLCESRKAFEASDEQNKLLREKAETQARALANIEELLRRARGGQDFRSWRKGCAAGPRRAFHWQQ
jgi:hypothetical protein